MKEIVKKFVKVLIIYVVITMTIFSTISYGYTPEEVGDAIAGYAAHVITDYGNKVRYSQNGRANNPIWSESYDWESSSEYFFDCTSYSTGCIHAVTGLLSSPLWTGAMLPSQVGNYTTDFDVIDYDKSKLLPGDVVFHDDGEAHGVVYLGKEYSAWGTSGEIGNNGSTFRSISYFDNNYVFYIFRIKEESAKKLTSLDTSFASGKISSGSGGMTGITVDYSNFYFNGIPDGKYSIASRKSVFSMIVETLRSLADFLTGLFTYLFKGVIISFISVFDRLINNTVAAMNGKKKSLKEAGISANDADDPMKINRYITIEGLIFGDDEMDLFDIDIFK